MLSKLKSAGYKIAILSNGSPAMLEAAIRGANIEDLLDASLSVNDVQIFKPDPRVYELATKAFNVEPQQVLFQSSNAWDASGAAAFGFKVMWVNRFSQRPERLPAKPDYEATNLNQLLELLNIAD